MELTNQRTVPQVFVGSEFIGGCDDTFNAYGQGELLPKLAEITNKEDNDK